MSKFKVGDEVAIAAVVKITAIQSRMNGMVSYNTDRGLSIHERLMDEIALSAKPTDRLMGREEPKPKTAATAPKFKVGDRVITSYGIGYVEEVDNTGSKGKPYRIKYDSGRLLWDKSAEARLVFSCEPQPAPKFKVGDRVVHLYIGAGNVSAINPNYRGQESCRVAFDNGSIHDCFFTELSPTPEPKYYSGKVRATGVRGTALETGKNESNSFIYDRIGVVYEFINGECERLGMHHTHNFDEIVKVCDCSTWHEVKK